MKNKEISCQVIQDILPLYEDGCCSEDSKNLVEEHLKTCTECQKLVSRYEEPVPVREEEKEPEVVSIQRGVRQIKRGKVAGFIALALVVAVFFVVIPLKNFIAGDGVTYANLKEIYMARSFGNAIAEGNYEKAYSYFTIEQDYDDLMEQYDEEARKLDDDLLQLYEDPCYNSTIFDLLYPEEQ